MKRQFTLGKNERLKSRKQIELLFSAGKKFVVGPFRIFYLIDSQRSVDNRQNILQFGVGVSNKNFNKAVDRNRIKRLIKEAWRLQKNELKEELKAGNKQLNVFIIYTGKELPAYLLIKDKVAVTLQKLSKMIDENISTNS